MTKKHFILDTNILIHEPHAYLAFQEHHVVIPMTVLEELDSLKDRKRDISTDARIAIRGLEAIFADVTPEEMVKGVPLPAQEGCVSGTISIFNDGELDVNSKNLDLTKNDNSIINCAIHYQQLHTEDVVLVTKDINMRIKSKSAGVKNVEDFNADNIIDDIAFLYKGYIEFKGDFWSYVNNVETQTPSKGQVIHKVDASIFEYTPPINSYIVDDSEELLLRVVQVNGTHVLLKDLGLPKTLNKEIWGIRAKNKQQAMAVNALIDPDIDLVTLTGPAGSGKTVLAVAAAIDLVLERGLYKRIIVTRSTPEIAESIGFLPGSESEKMSPWLAGITDSIEALHREDEDQKGSMDYLLEKANMQFKSINFVRGRSIVDSVVIVDESQNLTTAQLKTIITRVGQGSLLILLGNLAQIDSHYITAHPDLESLNKLLPSHYISNTAEVTRFLSYIMVFNLILSAYLLTLSLIMELTCKKALIKNNLEVNL